MNHAMAIGAQHRKVGRDIIGDGDALLQTRNRPQMMRLNKIFDDRAITFVKFEIASLATGAVEFLGLLGRGTVALHLAVIGIFASFNDGETTPRGPDGRTLDLTRLTADRQRSSDARGGPAIFGANNPEWRLFAHAPLRALLAEPGPDLPLYLAVWIADDESDGDGNPTLDTNGQILLWSVAFGTGGTRAAVEARIERAVGGGFRLLAWRQAR